VERAGLLLGVILIIVAVVRGCVHGESWEQDLLWSAVYGVPAILLLWLSGLLGTRLILRSRLPGELERGNVAAGIAAGGHFVANGVIIAACFHGDNVETLGISLVFLVSAQVSQHLLLILFRTVTAYDDDEEIAGENVAAALSYAGATVALGIIIAHAAEGTFEGWLVSFGAYGLALLLSLVLYPVRQLVVQTLLLGYRPAWRGGALDHAIARERNVGVSAVEAVAYLATALLVAGVA
jgi:uncharacterized membrane protein YjfL (UPF0719 family)